MNYEKAQTAGTPDGGSTKQHPGYVAVHEVWVQASSDYNAVRHLRTHTFEPTATVADVMAWVKRADCLQSGQVTLTEEDV